MTRPAATAPPSALEDWCRRFGETSLSGEGHALLEGAVMALRASLAWEGRDREAAFMLLAADALLTRACERAVDPTEALDAVDPAEALEAVLTRIGSAFPS